MRAAAVGAIVILVGDGAAHVVEIGTVHQAQATGLENKIEDHECAATGMTLRSGLPTSFE